MHSVHARWTPGGQPQQAFAKRRSQPGLWVVGSCDDLARGSAPLPMLRVRTLSERVYERGPTAGLLPGAPERPCQAIDPRIEGGALHGPIARPPGIEGRDQPVNIEVGTAVPGLTDIGTERWDAVVVQVRPERALDVDDLSSVISPFGSRVGRVAALLIYRSDVEDLELVLGREGTALTSSIWSAVGSLRSKQSPTRRSTRRL